jgi:hypothetical protein
MMRRHRSTARQSPFSAFTYMGPQSRSSRSFSIRRTSSVSSLGAVSRSARVMASVPRTDFRNPMRQRRPEMWPQPFEVRVPSVGVQRRRSWPVWPARRILGYDFPCPNSTATRGHVRCALADGSMAVGLWSWEVTSPRASHVETSGTFPSRQALP